MSDDLMHEIICLADRVDPDPEAVREWFFETPLFLHDKTAFELVQVDRGDAVMAFLRRILRDVDPYSKPFISHLLGTQHRQHMTMTSSHGT